MYVLYCVDAAKMWNCHGNDSFGLYCVLNAQPACENKLANDTSKQCSVFHAWQVDQVGICKAFKYCVNHKKIKIPNQRQAEY